MIEINLKHQQKQQQIEDTHTDKFNSKSSSDGRRMFFIGFYLFLCLSAVDEQRATSRTRLCYCWCCQGRRGKWKMETGTSTRSPTAAAAADQRQMNRWWCGNHEIIHRSGQAASDVDQSEARGTVWAVASCTCMQVHQYYSSLIIFPFRSDSDPIHIRVVWPAAKKPSPPSDPILLLWRRRLLIRTKQEVGYII